MEYEIHTNKTTPYYNCPTFTLKLKAEEITKMIDKVNSISGDELNYIEAGQLTAMLIELRKTVNAQIEYREKLKNE